MCRREPAIRLVHCKSRQSIASRLLRPWRDPHSPWSQWTTGKPARRQGRGQVDCDDVGHARCGAGYQSYLRQRASGKLYDTMKLLNQINTRVIVSSTSLCLIKISREDQFPSVPAFALSIEVLPRTHPLTLSPPARFRSELRSTLMVVMEIKWRIVRALDHRCG